MACLENKNAVILAASKGIGRACAEVFAESKANLYLADFDKKACDEAAEELSKKYGIKAKSLYFDATKYETYGPMIQEILADSKGSIQILINNYGNTLPDQDLDLMNTTLEAWHHVLLTNLDSVFIPTKLMLPAMIHSGGGNIVNISSMASIMPNLVRVAYNTSKGAINALTKNIATQYARNNIRCNTVLPGRIATENLKNSYTPELTEAYLRHVPLRRQGTPEDVAKAVLFLASDDSSYITGECIPVAGGVHMPTPQFADMLEPR